MTYANVVRASIRVLASLAALSLCLPLLSASPAEAATPPVRYIAVSAATLWVKPGIARPVDGPSLSAAADPRRWIADMSVAQKRWLNGKIDTQALYGTRVYVIGTSGRWSRIAVPTQPTPKSSWGYPGWVPTSQLTTRAPARTATTAVVTAPVAWVWRGAGSIDTPAGRLFAASFDTRFPVLAATTTYVSVAMLDGTTRYLRRKDVTVRGSAGWSGTPAQLVAQAKRFLGLQYLWAGTTGFGYDCSGFTYSLYHALGRTIPRDASRQLAAGRWVSKSALRPGDLIFFKNSSGAIVHVAMYYALVNRVHLVIESSRTGLPVRLTPLSAWTWQYAGARRFI